MRAYRPRLFGHLVQMGRRVFHVDVFETPTGWVCAFSTAKDSARRTYRGKIMCAASSSGAEHAAERAVRDWMRIEKVRKGFKVPGGAALQYESTLNVRVTRAEVGT